jgi:hypothetical protein
MSSPAVIENFTSYGKASGNYPWSMPYGRVTGRRTEGDVSRWTPFLNRSVT